jgi:hypothetical protein
MEITTACWRRSCVISLIKGLGRFEGLFCGVVESFHTESRRLPLFVSRGVWGAGVGEGSLFLQAQGLT